MSQDGKPFTLYGIRDIADSFTEPPPLIETLVNATERAVAEDSPTTFELSKALLDTTCKTILTDRGIKISNNWDTPELFKQTHNHLNFIPPAHPHPQKFLAGITNILKGLETAVNGFAQLRNDEGIIAHGQDGYHQVFFFTYQLEFVARATDAIVHFLFSTHRRNLSGSKANRIYYEDNAEFNDYVDEFHEATVIFEQVFTASKVLFDSDKDHTAYREMLEAWQIDKEAGLFDPDR